MSGDFPGLPPSSFSQTQGASGGYTPAANNPNNVQNLPITHAPVTGMPITADIATMLLFRSNAPQTHHHLMDIYQDVRGTPLTAPELASLARAQITFDPTVSEDLQRAVNLVFGGLGRIFPPDFNKIHVREVSRLPVVPGAYMRIDNAEVQSGIVVATRTGTLDVRAVASDPRPSQILRRAARYISIVTHQAMHLLRDAIKLDDQLRPGRTAANALAMESDVIQHRTMYHPCDKDYPYENLYAKSILLVLDKIVDATVRAEFVKNAADDIEDQILQEDPTQPEDFTNDAIQDAYQWVAALKDSLSVRPNWWRASRSTWEVVQNRDMNSQAIMDRFAEIVDTMALPGATKDEIQQVAKRIYSNAISPRSTTGPDGYDKNSYINHLQRIYDRGEGGAPITVFSGTGRGRPPVSPQECFRANDIVASRTPFYLGHVPPRSTPPGQATGRITVNFDPAYFPEVLKAVEEVLAEEPNVDECRISSQQQLGKTGGDIHICTNNASREDAQNIAAAVKRKVEGIFSQRSENIPSNLFSFRRPICVDTLQNGFYYSETAPGNSTVMIEDMSDTIATAVFNARANQTSVKLQLLEENAKKGYDPLAPWRVMDPAEAAQTREMLDRARNSAGS